MKVLAVVSGIVLSLALVLLGWEAVGFVLFGWVGFLIRVLPKIDPDPATVVTGCVALICFAVGVHFTGRRWVKGWRVRWTAMAVVAVGLLFGVGVAVIGITHQVSWLVTAGEPLQAPGPPDRWKKSSHNNLKMLKMGAENYQDTFMQLPSGGTFSPEGMGKHSWTTQMLPYFGYYAPHVDMDQPWNHPTNRLYLKCVIPELINPDFRTAPIEDPEGYGFAHYAANGRVMGPNTKVKLSDLPDGGWNIALIGEVNDGFRPWGHPENWREPTLGTGGGPAAFGNPAGTGATFVFGDGSVRFMTRSTDPAVLDALAGPKR